MLWLKDHADRLFEKLDFVMVVEDQPKCSVSSLVNVFKGPSSRLLRQERPAIAKRYWKGVLRSPRGFVASSWGACGNTSNKARLRPEGRGFRRGDSP